MADDEFNSQAARAFCEVVRKFLYEAVGDRDRQIMIRKENRQAFVYMKKFQGPES